MGYFGRISTIVGIQATVEVAGYGIVTGLLSKSDTIQILNIGDLVFVVFTSNDFQQGIIIAKVGDFGVDNINNILGANNINNAFISDLVTPNKDGSIIERLEDLSIKTGETSDNAGNLTLLGYGSSTYQHIHQPAKCYPSLANGITVTGGAGVWQLGDFVQIIPENTIIKMFDVHWINFESASANDTYELVLYSGLSGAEVEIGRIRTKKDNTVSSATNVPIQIPVQHANNRISAKLASSSGNDNVTLSLFYHEYN